MPFNNTDHQAEEHFEILLLFLKKFIGKPCVSDATCFLFDSNHLDSKYTKAKKVIADFKAR